MGSLGDGAQRTGLHHLPFRIRDSSCSKSHPTKDGHVASSPANSIHKRYPNTLNFLGSDSRLRSPTESSMSSVPDSATSYSHSTVASPLSSSYTSDLQDLLICSRPNSRVRHRHQPSTGTCSTFVNDEDDVHIVSSFSDYGGKGRELKETVLILPEPEKGSDTVQVTPTTEGFKKDDVQKPPKLSEDSDEDLSASADPFSDKWENTSTVSNNNECSNDDADLILDFTLQLAYGMNVGEASVEPSKARQLVQKFVRELGQNIWNNGADTQQSNTMSATASLSSTPAGSGTGDSQRGGKRKKQGARGEGNDEADELTDGEGNGGGGDGYVPAKRPKPNPKEDENLRLSCPYRKRNPKRFNVRDHHSCSLTYFPKFSELRQHIVKQHKRDDPSAFVCDRCNRDFTTRKELRDHQRLPKEQICDIANFNPENGVDGPTANKLLSRKRASGSSPEVQWREIWNILFPDDDDYMIQPYLYTPVIEHFELSSNYLDAFSYLKSSLRDKMSNPATLETLATKFHQCFVETMERCIADAQNMPYVNRSNKRNEVGTTVDATRVLARKVKEVLPRPDSGVVITDDGSEESGSVMGSVSVGGPMPGYDTMGTGMTVYSSRRTSNLVPAPFRDSSYASRTSSAIFDGPLPQPPQPVAMVPSSSMAPLPMNPSESMGSAVDIQAWTDGLFPTSTGDGVADFFDAAGGDGQMSADMSAWSQSFYHGNVGMGMGMGNDFSDFNNTR